jgi:membrane-associated protease RseP (regulator of RpoE activity)
MEDRQMNRSWTIAAASATAGAAALSFGLFLAVGREGLADSGGSGDKTVRIVTVPGDEAEAVAAYEADEESRYGKSGYLGVSLREDTKSNEGGALVKNVVDDSPAAKAGVKDGDVIVGFGGDIVRGPAKVTEKLRASKPGDKVVLDVRRDGKTQKLTVELGDRPSIAWSYHYGDSAPMSEEAQRELELSLKSLDGLPDVGKRLGKMKFYAPGRNGMLIFGRNKPLRGIEMVETTPDLRVALGGSKDAGVLVGKVLSGSAAEKSGLKVGDLILSVEGTKVADAGDLAEVIGKQEGKTVDLDIVRDKKPMKLRAVLPKIDEPEDEPTGPRASVWRVTPVAPVAPAPAVAPPAAPAPPSPPARVAPPAPPAPPTPPCELSQFV